MKALLTIFTLVLLSGCSAIPIYGEYKATPEEVLQRQDTEKENLKTYHKSEREYYLQLSIQNTTSGADQQAQQELQEAEISLEEAKENAVIR